jgi:copper chaperone CopZ
LGLTTEGVSHLSLTQWLGQVCCEAEVRLIKSLLEPLPGVLDVRVSAVARVALVKHQTPAEPQALLEVLNRGKARVTKLISCLSPAMPPTAAHLGAAIQDVSRSRENLAVPDERRTRWNELMRVLTELHCGLCIASFVVAVVLHFTEPTRPPWLDAFMLVVTAAAATPLLTRVGLALRHL